MSVRFRVVASSGAKVRSFLHSQSPIGGGPPDSLTNGCTAVAKARRLEQVSGEPGIVATASSCNRAAPPWIGPSQHPVGGREVAQSSDARAGYPQCLVRLLRLVAGNGSCLAANLMVVTANTPAGRGTIVRDFFLSEN